MEVIQSFLQVSEIRWNENLFWANEKTGVNSNNYFIDKHDWNVSVGAIHF